MTRGIGMIRMSLVGKAQVCDRRDAEDRHEDSPCNEDPLRWTCRSLRGSARHRPAANSKTRCRARRRGQEAISLCHPECISQVAPDDVGKRRGAGHQTSLWTLVRGRMGHEWSARHPAMEYRRSPSELCVSPLFARAWPYQPTAVSLGSPPRRIRGKLRTRMGRTPRRTTTRIDDLTPAFLPSLPP